MITPRGAAPAEGLGDWGRDEQPERIGPYEITGVLGKGGMGVVFDAIDQQRRRVALKVIRPQGDPENAQLLTARFLREAKILQELDHPSVVRLVDSGDVEGILYLAMERIEGVSLLTIRRRGALGFDPLVSLGIQLADALAHMHEAGIVHRDIKPANILIDARGQPIITDFGISGMSEATGITRMGDLLGSPGFMAPEVTEGIPPSPHSDQFALGRLLYELGASGPAKKLPKNAPILEILSASLEIDWNRFPKNDRWTELEQILRRTVATTPKERYPSCRQVKSALQALTSSDLLDSETLSEHVHNLNIEPRPAFDDMGDWPHPELKRALARARTPNKDEPFAEETTVDAEDVTVPPSAFHPPPLPAKTEPPTKPDPPARDDTPPLPAPRLLSTPGSIPDRKINEPEVREPSALLVRPVLESDSTPAEPVPTVPADPAQPVSGAPRTAAGLNGNEPGRSSRPAAPPDPAISSTAVTLQDMPLFELAKRDEAQAQQVQVVDVEELQIARLERQISRMKEQLAQARKDALRPIPSPWGKIFFTATLALALGSAAGFLLARSYFGEAEPLVMVAPYGPDATGPKVVYRGETAPNADTVSVARALASSARAHMKKGDYGAAEVLFAQCIDTADLPECHKALGTLLALRADPAAHAHFEHYLTIAPNAPDAAAIRRLLQKP